MRQTFWILLFCLAFGNVLTNLDIETRTRLGRVVRFMMAIKEINERNLRKLQSTDSTDGEEGYKSPNATEFDPRNNNTEGAEVGVATAADGQVPANKPVSTKIPPKNNKNNQVQILKFHSFETLGKIIKFGSIFYFIRKRIPFGIFLRLRVTYSSRLRNLQSGMADSLRTECLIDDPTQAGVQATGNNVNYNCNATASQDPSNANITLNTDYGLVFLDEKGEAYETVGFDQISMNGNASEEAANLQDNKDKVSKVGSLKSSSAYGNTSTLTIKGIPNPTDTLDGVSDIKMDLYDKNDAKKQYDCKVTTESPRKVLTCDASSQQISTTSEKLHLSTGYASTQKVLLTVEMGSYSSDDEINAGSNPGPYYSKSSSSGLSGGAIAGIVIACVVVLLAATVAAIMLKKPSPSVDNTTVAELKTDNI